MGANPPGLNANQAQIIFDIFKQELPFNEVWVFGSRAGIHYKPHSDLDLAIIDPPSVSEEARSRIEGAFEESDLPFRVEIVLWSELPEALQKQILSAHSKLYP
jgi:predicted nucleotidyltransferase